MDGLTALAGLIGGVKLEDSNQQNRQPHPSNVKTEPMTRPHAPKSVSSRNPAIDAAGANPRSKNTRKTYSSRDVSSAEYQVDSRQKKDDGGERRRFADGQLNSFNAADASLDNKNAAHTNARTAATIAMATSMGIDLTLATGLANCDAAAAALQPHSLNRLASVRHTAPPRRPRHWTPEEDELLRNAVNHFGEQKWKQIALCVPDRNHTQCLQRFSKVLKKGIKKGQWADEEDKILFELVTAQEEEEMKEGKHRNQVKIRWGALSEEIEGRTGTMCVCFCWVIILWPS
jgi:hypothetical protein